MNPQRDAARRAALQHLDAALALDFRGRARDLVREARSLLLGGPQEPSAAAYQRLAVGRSLLDPTRPGLLMEHRSRDGRVWYVRFVSPTSARQVKLRLGVLLEAGGPKHLGVAEAREAWQRLRDEIRAGREPKPSAAPAAGMTLGALIDRYVADYAKVTKRSWAEDERLLRRHLAPLAQRAARSIDRAAVGEVLWPLRQKAPREAEKLRAAISTAYEVAAGRTRRVDLPDPWLPGVENPVRDLRFAKPDGEKAARYEPEPAHYRAYVRLIHDVADKTVQAALWLQLRLGLRPAEAIEAVWTEFDLDRGRWRLPAARMKAKVSHLVVLPPAILAELRARREAAPDAVFVFPHPGEASRPMRARWASDAVAAAREEYGLPDVFTPHCARHLLASWVSDHGGDLEIRDRLLAHRPPATVDRHYTKAERLTEQAAGWWAKWSTYLVALAAGDNVVPLPGHGA